MLEEKNLELVDQDLLAILEMEGSLQKCDSRIREIKDVNIPTLEANIPGYTEIPKTIRRDLADLIEESQELTKGLFGEIQALKALMESISECKIEPSEYHKVLTFNKK